MLKVRLPILISICRYIFCMSIYYYIFKNDGLKIQLANRSSMMRGNEIIVICEKWIVHIVFGISRIKHRTT